MASMRVSVTKILMSVFVAITTSAVAYLGIAFTLWKCSVSDWDSSDRLILFVFFLISGFIGWYYYKISQIGTHPLGQKPS